jgi:hypothetical protein
MVASAGAFDTPRRPVVPRLWEHRRPVVGSSALKWERGQGAFVGTHKAGRVTAACAIATMSLSSCSAIGRVGSLVKRASTEVLHSNVCADALTGAVVAAAALIEEAAAEPEAAFAVGSYALDSTEIRSVAEILLKSATASASAVAINRFLSRTVCRRPAH